MSTALSEPFHLDPSRDEDTPAEPARHLRAIADQPLRIDPVPGALATDVRQASTSVQPIVDPKEEYAPSRDQPTPIAQSNVFYLSGRRTEQLTDRYHLLQHESIQKMTRTIGAAFIEAELGLRPFMQLSSWIELELFQKLRTRVEHTVNGKYFATQRGGEDCTKVPSITPIAVRATVCADGEWETSMTIRVGQRARAIAMRLQLHRERWRVIAFEIG